MKQNFAQNSVFWMQKQVTNFNLIAILVMDFSYYSMCQVGVVTHIKGFRFQIDNSALN